MEAQFKFELRKERDFGEKVNGTFTFISQNFKPLFRCFIYIPLPIAIFAGIAMGMFQSNMFKKIQGVSTVRSERWNQMSNQLEVFSNLLSPSYFIAIVFMALANMLVFTTTFAYMKLYATEGRENISFEMVWEIVKQKILSLIIYGFLISLLIGIATVFIVIPGIYLAIVFSLFIPVFVFEDRGFSDSFNRCFYLIKDKWWSTFGLLIVMYIIVGLANFIFQIPQLAITFLNTLKLYNDDFPALHIFAGIVSSVGTFMLYSLIAIALGLQYFNLVERKEGIGLRGLIDKIGSEQVSPKNDLGEF